MKTTRRRTTGQLATTARDLAAEVHVLGQDVERTVDRILAMRARAALTELEELAEYLEDPDLEVR